MIIRTRWLAVLAAAMSVIPLLAASASLAEEEQGHESEENAVVELSADDRAANGVTTATVEFRGLTDRVILPAEVVINAYESASVTTRIPAQVTGRHVKLGDLVDPDQPLLTLSSVEMAEAQGELIVAGLEWQRMRTLGKATVSERVYLEAEVMHRQALARVLAYGMSAEQVSAMMKPGAVVMATGEFVLLAPRQGTVLSDDFVTGELIEPGRVLFTISDESTLWIEASTVPSDLTNFEIGTPARIAHGEDHWIIGRVIQLHHQLDETTRRQGLRIEIDNAEDHLHPGQFVEAEISTAEGPPVLAVPSKAITLIAGNSSVFLLENEHEFYPQVVEIGVSAGGWTEIRSGIGEGDEVADSGVFFIKSLLLKSSLGEGHGH